MFMIAGGGSSFSDHDLTGSHFYFHLPHHVGEGGEEHGGGIFRSGGFYEFGGGGVMCIEMRTQ